MKKFVSALCAVGLFFLFEVTIQAEKADQHEFWGIIPGECFLDGIISPPHRSIGDMDGFEVPLVANWIPVRQNEGTQYGGEAIFGVSNFKIGEGELIDAYTVDIDLNLDDPDISGAQRDNLLIYSCEDVPDSCTATLIAVKAAITEQIARDYKAAVGEVTWDSDARANFLGVFVKDMNQPGTGIGKEKGQINILTEVCGTYEITLAEALTLN